MDCGFIATGHYAQLREREGRYYVPRAKTRTRPELCAVGTEPGLHVADQIPLGHLHKTEIKQMARDMGLVELANKPESYEICFMPDNDYRGFLKRRVDGLEERVDGVCSWTRTATCWQTTRAIPSIPSASGGDWASPWVNPTS